MGKSFAAIAWLSLLLAAGPAGAAAQGTDFPISVTPPVPAPGDIVSVGVRLPGLDPLSVELREPSVSGGMRFSGSRIAPYRDPDGGSGADLAFEFAAVSPGRAAILDFGVRARGKPVRIGSYVIEISGDRERAPREGRWTAPGSAYKYQSFEASQSGPDGARVKPDAASRTVAGAYAEPFGDALVVTPYVAGSVTLPASSGEDGSGRFSIPERSVRVLDTPPELERTKAVGVLGFEWAPFPSSAGIAAPGPLSIGIYVTGTGNPRCLEPPILVVEGPKGRTRLRGVVERGARLRFRFSFVPSAKGRYSIRPEPYPSWDPEARALRWLALEPLEFAVADPGSAEGAAGPGKVHELSRELIDALALADGGAGIDPAADAVRCLASGDVPRSYATLAGLARRGKTGRLLSLGLREAEAILGIASKPRDVLPAPRWIGYAAIAASAGFVILVAAGGPAKRRGAIYATLVAAALAGLLWIASTMERSKPFFVTREGSGRAVPSEISGEAFPVREGNVGRILAGHGPWRFAEFPDGRSAWMAADELYEY